VSGGGARRADVAALASTGLDAIDPYYTRYLPQLVLAAVVPPGAPQRPPQRKFRPRHIFLPEPLQQVVYEIQDFLLGWLRKQLHFLLNQIYNGHLSLRHT
jgi:hypothetical protein